MELYSQTATNESGDIVNGASVSVTVTSSGAPATIFDKDGVSLSNPFLTGYDRTKGEVEFQAENGLYNVTVTGNLAATKVNQSLLDTKETINAGDINAENIDLSAVDAAAFPGITTAVAVSNIHEPFSESDWTLMMGDKSWYAANGAPTSRMVTVVEASNLVIFDLTQSTPIAWGTYDFTGFTITAVKMVSGAVWVATTTGIVVLDFVNDTLTVELKYSTATTPAIVNNTCNDIATTILPNAPLDDSGLVQVPTDLAGTDGGSSFIKDDETVVDVTSAAMISVDIQSSGRNAMASITDVYIFNAVPSVDTTTASADFTLNSSSVPAITGTIDSVEWADDVLYIATTDEGLYALKYNQTTPAESILNKITSSFQSGQQAGDIKRAFLADTSTASGDSPDRSVNAGNLVENGTVPRTSLGVADEAIVAHGPFSATNYYEEAYSADLDFGTGDFYVMGWLKQDASSTTDYLMDRRSGSTSGMAVYVSGAEGLSFKIASTITETTNPIATGVWIFYAAVRKSGVLSLYQDGAFILSEASASTVDATTPALTLGINYTKTSAIEFNGSLVAWRIGAVAPSAEQIKFIYNAERPLIVNGADAVLGGASDVIADIAWDDYTNQLKVQSADTLTTIQGSTVMSTEASTATLLSASDSEVIAE